MASGQQKRSTLDEKARQGETVVPGGTGGKSLEAQEHLAEGRSRGGQTRKEQLGTEGYKEMGRKGGLSTGAGGRDAAAEEAAAEGGRVPGGADAGGAAEADDPNDPDFDVDESKM